MEAARDTGPWWDWRLLGRWVLVNALAYVIVIVGGVALEALASDTVRILSHDHRLLAIAIVSVLGAGFQGMVLGRWQWRILRHRMPRLEQRRWVVATFVPALVVWSFGLAPGAIDVIARGGDAIEAFRFGFSRALVLGPLIGLAQATALRGFTSRWMWWFVANVTTFLIGSGLWRVGEWLLADWGLSGEVSPAFPVLGFAIDGAWMLWVTEPATRDLPDAISSGRGRSRAGRGHGRAEADPSRGSLGDDTD